MMRKGRFVELLFAIVVSALALGALWVFLRAWVARNMEGVFDQAQWSLGTQWPGWLKVMIFVMGGVALFNGIRSASVLPTSLARVLGASARIVVVTMAIMLCFSPTVLLRDVTQAANTVVVVVDDSRSMDIPQKNATRKERGETLALELERRFANSDEHRVVQRQLSELEEAAGRTPIRIALDAVRKSYSPEQLGGIVLLSDGVATGDFQTEDLEYLRQYGSEYGSPIHAVFLGGAVQDVGISRVEVDQFAFVRTVAKVNLSVWSNDFDGQTVSVRLLRDGEPLREKSVTLKGGYQDVSFEIAPDRVGDFVYRVSIVAPAEDQIQENNDAFFSLRVMREKVRVLHVAGAPSWDVRVLRDWLKNNPNIDLVSFFILRTFEDLSNRVSPSEMALIQFPTRELFERQLRSFDLVVFHNFDYLPYEVGKYLGRIRNFVETGGGFVMIGGEKSFASGGYQGTRLARLLPFELPRNVTGELFDDREFSGRLTTAGERHPISSLSFSQGENRKTWAGLPPFVGHNFVGAIKKTGTVLVEHPSKKAGGKRMPVVAINEFGQGRVLALAIDSMWKWTLDDGGREHYRKFWGQAFRWLMKDPDYDLLTVSPASLTFDSPSQVQVTFQLKTPDFQPLSNHSIKYVLFQGEKKLSAEQVMEGELTTDAHGRVRWEPELSENGVYRVLAQATVQGRELKAESVFLIRPGSGELRRVPGRPELLESLSEGSGGTFLKNSQDLGELKFRPPLVVRVNEQKRLLLWANPLLLILIIGVLLGEWGLRRRHRYL